MTKNFKKKIIFLFFALMCVAVLFFALICFQANKVNHANNSDEIAYAENKDLLDFVWVEKQTVYLGESQHIVISFNKSINTKDVWLEYHNDKETYTRESYKIDGNDVAFTLDGFDDISQVGAYTLDCIKWGGNEPGYQNIEVNKDYGFTFAVTTKSYKDNSEATIYTINQNGQIDKDSGIETSVEDLKSKLVASPELNSLKDNPNETYRIMLDPGHGGSDPGACGYGLRESDINLSIAQACANELKQYDGLVPYMTRDTDVDVGLLERCQMAHNINAHLFISFHINAGGGSGFEVWIQNSSSYKYNLSAISASFGAKISQKLAKFGFIDRGLKQRNHPTERYADGSWADYLAVLRYCRVWDIPSCLIEHLFIDNPNDAAFLSVPQNQWAMGQADAEAIAEVLGKEKEPGSVINGTYTISSAIDKNFVLDFKNSSTAEFEPLRLEAKNDIKSQKWRITTDSDTKLATIINVNSNKSLDVLDFRAVSTNTIQQHCYSDNLAQKWKIVDKGDGKFKICSAINSSFVLDVAGQKAQADTQVWLYASNDSNAQRFGLEQVQYQEEAANIEDGEYLICSAMNNNQVVGIDRSQLSATALVEVYHWCSMPAQKWNITTDKQTGKSKIKNVNSGLYLDVAYARNNPKTGVWQYSDDGSPALEWRIVKNGDSYSLLSCLNENLSLDLRGYNCADANKTCINTYTLLNSNKFDFISTKPDVKPSTADIEEGRYFISSFADSIKTIDLDTATQSLEGGKIQIWDKDPINSPNQLWNIKKDGEGYYRITSARSNKSWDLDGGSYIPGAKVHQWSSVDSNIQRWAIDKYDNGYRFTNVASGLCLSIKDNNSRNGQILVGSNNKSSNYQKWGLSKYEGEKGDIIEWRYVISSALNNRKVMDIPGASKQDMANVQIYDFNNTVAQKFDITTDHDTHLAIIKNVNSDKVFDVAGGQAYLGAKVVQNTYNESSKSQRWKIVRTSNGVKIISALNDNFVLDLQGANTANGNSFWLYDTNNTLAQRFNLYDCSPEVQPSTASIENGYYQIFSHSNLTHVIDLDVATQSLNGGKVQTWVKVLGDHPNQCFKIASTGDGYYSITSAVSEKAIDVDGGAYFPQTKVHQWDFTPGSDIQKWAIYNEAGSNVYTFRNVASGLYLDIVGSRAVSGSALCANPQNYSSSQNWNLVKANPSLKHPIMTSPRCSVSQMIAYWNSTGHTYPSYYKDNNKGADTITDFCNICMQEATVEGVDPAILFCQAMKETGWLGFGGLVKIEQCNFGGLGATGGGVSGATFENVRIGLRAQVQHLKAYASTTTKYANPICDPRWNLVTKGCAPNLEDLDGKWAVPGKDYGEYIWRMITTMLSF